jgi:hypothetical protein
MPFFVSIAVDPLATLPAGSRISASVTGYFDRLFPITSPGYLEDWVYPDPSSRLAPSLPTAFPLNIEVFVGHRTPIRLEATIKDDNSRLAFLVLPGTPHDRRYFFAGNIVHPRPLVVSATATSCVTCLNDGKTASPGSCIDCENDDAIVQLCC